MDPFDLRLWPGFLAAGGDPSMPAVVEQIAIDSRQIATPHALFVPLQGKNHDGHSFIANAAALKVRYALAKQGWRSQKPLQGITLLYVPDPLIALQEIATHYRMQQSCRLIAIAGTHGKTMVKDLLQSLLATSYAVAASPGSFNSQIGVPLSLLTIRKSDQVALIEAGFSHSGEMQRLSSMVKADAVIITHVGKKHLPTLGSMATLAAEMKNILDPAFLKLWGLFPKDPHLIPHLSSLACPLYFWDCKDNALPHASYCAQGSSSHILYRLDFPSPPSQHPPYEGEGSGGHHYFCDLLNMSIKAAFLLGITPGAIKEVISSYRLDPIRTEIWQAPHGTTFINDSYCSDISSLNIALKQLQEMPTQGKKLFLFGGMRDNKNHHSIKQHPVADAIAQTIASSDIDECLLFGEQDFSVLEKAIQRRQPTFSLGRASTYSSALQQLAPRLQRDDAVLIKGSAKYPLDPLLECFNDSILTNQCFINLAAIEANIAAIRKKLTKDTRLMVMVKAFAYGTDQFRMAQFLDTQGIDILGVSYVEEGVALKKAGAKQAIFAIHAAAYEAAKVVKWNLEVGVSNKAIIDALAHEANSQQKALKVHLHIDTGMGRFGCRPEDAVFLAKEIANHPSLILEGAMTHFACADDPCYDDFTLKQAKALEGVMAELAKEKIFPNYCHASNSSASIRFSFPNFNMARIGLSAYGLYASPAVKEALELRLALSLTSRIVGINSCRQGESVSYGRSYSIKRPQERIAVVPIGYFDGLHRNYSGKSYVLIRGKKAPMVGNICMDFMMVDISDIGEAKEGDGVLIFGEDEYGHYLSPEELATSGDSIVYELITCLGPRISRIFIYEEDHRKH